MHIDPESYRRSMEPRPSRSSGNVTDLDEWRQALRARGALDDLLGEWGWYLRAEVEVQPSRIVVLAIITVACSSDVRRDIYVCIPSRVNGFPVETRPRNPAKVRPSAPGRGAEPIACRGIDQETE